MGQFSKIRWVNFGVALPAYSGSSPDVAKLYLSNVGTASCPAMIIAFSPTSGVLAVYDSRTNSVRNIGWDTGFDRVLDLRVVSSKVADPVEFLGVGWSDQPSISRLFKITIPQSGGLSQQAFGPPSNTGNIWVRTGIIDSSAYIYDLQTHRAHRLIDTNADGIPDANDPTFSVALPVVYDSVYNPDDVTPIDLNPFKYFHRPTNSPQDIVAFMAHLDLYDSRPICIKHVSGTYSVERQDLPDLPPRTFVTISGNLSAGQKRVFVFGEPGTSFEIHSVDAAGTETLISKKWTIPISRLVVVDLKTSLIYGEKIRATSTDPTFAPMPWRNVAFPAAPVVLSPLDEFVAEKSKIAIEGWGLDANHHEFWAQIDNQTVIFSSTVTNGGTRVSLWMPDLGAPGTIVPAPNVTSVDIQIRDKATGTTIEPHRSRIRIRHN